MNPTAPAGETADFYRGWNARAGADGTAPAPSPAPTPAPAPTAADLQHAFASAKTGENQLPAGTFTVPVGAITCAVAGATFRGNGKTRIVFQPVPGSSTGIAVRAANVTIDGVLFDSHGGPAVPAKVNVNVVRTYAKNTTVSNCAASNIDDLVFFEPQSSGQVLHCAALDKTIRADFIFVGGAQDILIDSCPGKDSPFTGSWNEHWIRIDAMPEPPSANTAARVTIQNSALRNFDGKESVAVRTANALDGSVAIKDPKPEHGVRIINCDCYAWGRGGQVAATGAQPPAMSVRLLTFTNCRFHEKAYVQIDQGTTAAIDATFDNFTAYCPIHVQGPNVQLTANVKLVDMPNQPGINHELVLVKGLSPADSVVVNGVEMNPARQKK